MATATGQRAVWFVLAAALTALLLLLLPRNACAASLPPTAQTYPVPSEVDATGGRDVTADLSAFLAGAPDHAVVVFAENGRYRVEGTIEIRGRRGLTIEGNGATVFATATGAPTRAHLRVVDSSDIAIRNLAVEGPHTAGGSPAAFVDELQYQHAIDLRGVGTAVIDRVDVHNVYGDCVYIGLGSDGRHMWSRDVSVTELTCARNGRQGVAVTAGENVTVTDSHLDAVGLSAFDVEPNGTGDGARGIEFRDNSVTATGQWFVVVTGHAPVSDVVVADNRVRGMSLWSRVALERSARAAAIRFENNTSDTTGPTHRSGAIIDAHRVDGLDVTGNVQPVPSRRHFMVSPRDSCDVTVERNSLPLQP